MKNPIGLGTQREPRKKKCRISDGFGLNSPAIKKMFSPKKGIPLSQNAAKTLTVTRKLPMAAGVMIREAWSLATTTEFGFREKPGGGKEGVLVSSVS